MIAVAGDRGTPPLGPGHRYPQADRRRMNMRKILVALVLALAACGQGTKVEPEAHARVVDTTAPRFLPHVACARLYDEDPFGTVADYNLDREAFLAACVTNRELLDQLRDRYGP